MLLSRKLELLSDVAARQLFQECAGRRGATDAGPAGLEGEIIRACGGLPLALELAGGILYGVDNADMWRVSNACLHAHVAHPALEETPT